MVVKREDKGAPLTAEEFDANFITLDNALKRIAEILGGAQIRIIGGVVYIEDYKGDPIADIEIGDVPIENTTDSGNDIRPTFDNAFLAADFLLPETTFLGLSHTEISTTGKADIRTPYTENQTFQTPAAVSEDRRVSAVNYDSNDQFYFQQTSQPDTTFDLLVKLAYRMFLVTDIYYDISQTNPGFLVNNNIPIGPPQGGNIPVFTQSVLSFFTIIQRLRNRRVITEQERLAASARLSNSAEDLRSFFIYQEIPR